MKRIRPSEVSRRMERGDSIVFIDARSRESWADSDVAIPGSIRVPPDDIEANLGAVPRGGTFVAYCT
jgi:rhodanese-related sulfurtransferase